MKKNWTLELAILSAILAVVCIVLAVDLHQQSRFVQTKATSPYIMFDTRTGQACWSGPKSKPPNPIDEALAEHWTPPEGDMPLCKDL
jgi:hypothetical protein